MNDFATMYHYFKGISNTCNSSSTASDNNIIIEKQMKVIPAENKTKPSAPIITDQEYVEMSGSDRDSGGSINAVTNLNYINVETNSKDEEIMRNLDDLKITADSEIMSNELKILEPAYYESNEINKTDEFSAVCSSLLESCSELSSVEPDQSATNNYLIQPSNIPVQSQQKETISMDVVDFGDYLTHPSNKPVDLKGPPTNQLSDYLIQPSNRKVQTELTEQSHVKMCYQKKEPKSRTGSLRRQGSDSSKASVDDELLEIMNDFKNNVFSIQEVEQLVVSWKNRNDVQQSYKDKQEQLQRMRTEYERLQEQMKEKMKRPTPFERVKKLFSRSKSISLDETNEGGTGGNSTQRPMSSLSLQSISSSSSSGRMSTASVCSGASLGDSGTHSDHEERRHVFNSSTCRIGHPGSLMLDNYLIPPMPRPISSTATSPVDDVCRKFIPPFNNGKLQISDVSENYSLFPSNIPVDQHHHHQHTVSSMSNNNNGHHHDYMNFSGLNTIEETKETGPDVVTATLLPIKVQKPDQIYGLLKKQNSTDLCTSFKPSNNSTSITTPTSPCAIINQEYNVYFNQNKLESNASGGVVSIDNEETVNLRCGADSGNHCTMHDYMNV